MYVVAQKIILIVHKFFLMLKLILILLINIISKITKSYDIFPRE